jgi:hypothetical protein
VPGGGCVSLLPLKADIFHRRSTLKYAGPLVVVPCKTRQAHGEPYLPYPAFRCFLPALLTVPVHRRSLVADTAVGRTFEEKSAAGVRMIGLTIYGQEMGRRRSLESSPAH